MNTHYDLEIEHVRFISKMIIVHLDKKIAITEEKLKRNYVYGIIKFFKNI